VLLLTPLLWGATFPATKIVLRRIPILTFMAWTRGLGFLAILIAVPLLRRSGQETQAAPWRRLAGPGLLLGALIFVAYLLQTEGLARTTATNAGFITCLYVVLTPILAAVVFRGRSAHGISRAAWIAVAASVSGLALLSIRHLGSIHLYSGDLLVAGGAVAWAGHLVGISHFSPRFPAWQLSLTQMGVTAVLQLAVVAPAGLRPAVVAGHSVWPLLVLTGVFGSGVAYTLQIMGQRRLSVVRAVVLLAGEAIFSAIFSAVWIGERLSLHQWFGAALVLAAMAWSELSARRSTPIIEPASAA
jgi:drug/metabolite transporter (DMT)-like permease